MDSHPSIKNLKTLYITAFKTLAPGRERNEVRTFFEGVAEDIEIPIFDIPLPQELRTP